MRTVNPQSGAIFFGFDSAWTDSPRNPGAICAIAYSPHGDVTFEEPKLASFDEASEYIRETCVGYGYAMVAIDQPTVVPNEKGSRPVDKVAGSLVSFIGGGEPRRVSRRRVALSLMPPRHGPPVRRSALPRPRRAGYCRSARAVGDG